MNRDGVMESSLLLTVMEVFTGVGRGMYSTAQQVDMQAIAGVSSVAISTAFFLTFNSVGTLIGTAIAGGIWNEVAINKLRENLPVEAKHNVTAIFKNIKVALGYKEGTPIRTAISLSYRKTEQLIGWITLVIVMPMLVLMFFVREVKLDGKQDIYGSRDVETDRGCLDEKEMMEVLGVSGEPRKENLD
jgi:uncharacterized membrane protein AbrB (regulator of aidB expression)